MLKINEDNMSSFDIKSLFTSLPTIENIKVCAKERFNLGLEPMNLRQEVLEEL